MSIDRIRRHRPFKTHRTERLFMNMTLKEQVDRLYKRLIVNTLWTIMQFRAIKSHKLIGIGIISNSRPNNCLSIKSKIYITRPVTFGTSTNNFIGTKIEGISMPSTIAQKNIKQLGLPFLYKTRIIRNLQQIDS